MIYSTETNPAPEKRRKNHKQNITGKQVDVLDDPEVTANLYCNFAYLYWEGCVIAVYILR